MKSAPSKRDGALPRTSVNADFPFTFAKIKSCFEEVLANGYQVIRCDQYLEYKRSRAAHKVLVNRVDIDFDLKKAKRLASIFNDLGIHASFFVRLHAPEYNPFDFENFRCLKFIRDSGHEIGLHSEVVDFAAICNEEQAASLKRDLEILGLILGSKIESVASHGGMTSLNNLDFWKTHKPSDFDLKYEVYDRADFNLFQEALYVSDSNWVSWKCYDRGVLRANDTRSLAEHCRDNPQIIYSLIHSDTYYDEHFYE